MNEQEAIKQLIKLKAVKQLAKALFNISLTPKQEEIVRTIAFSEHKRVEIICPTRYGKSYSLSIATLLWILLNPGKKVAIVAPTNEKTTIIRNQIAAFVTISPVFTALLDLERRGNDKIRKEVSKKRMTWKNGVEMRTLSAEGKGEQLMGFGAHLVLVDESCDIDYEVYQTRITRMLGEGGKDNDSMYVEIGNPWHRDNHFYEHWIDPNYKHIHIGWRDAVKEGRISQSFIDEQKSILPERHFKVLYEADFPLSSEDQLIDWAWINKSINSFEIDPTHKKEILIGVDVAEMGVDSTVVTVVIKDLELNKYQVTNIFSWEKTETMPTVSKILPLIDKFNPDLVQIDANGVGSGVYSRLEELKREGRIKCNVKAFKGGLSSERDDPREKFLNTKAESYWHLRKLFEDGKISIINNRDLTSQLNKMKWELTSSEKIRIRDPGEKEGDTAEQKSPDFSDSLNIACWYGGKSKMIMFNLGKTPEVKHNITDHVSK